MAGGRFQPPASRVDDNGPAVSESKLGLPSDPEQPISEGASHAPGRAGSQRYKSPRIKEDILEPAFIRPLLSPLLICQYGSKRRMTGP